MLTEPLPQTLDIRKAAAREVTVSGVVKPANLPRFRELLASDEGEIEAEFTFSRDEEKRYLVHLHLKGQVEVTCQRCLEAMPQQLGGENQLAVVWTDEQARHLPRHLDPLIEPEEASNLWELVEEELMLSLPQYSYHNTDECKERLAPYREPAPEAGADAEKPNPFDVLAQLKPGNKQE